MPTPKNYRVTVDGTSLCAYCATEGDAIAAARRFQQMHPAREVLAVQLRPAYRVLDVPR